MFSPLGNGWPRISAEQRSKRQSYAPTVSLNMHYRHQFHAGNFADVFKHVLLVALLEALNSKEKPWCYLDTHAGAGAYDLGDGLSPAGAEWQYGAARLLALPEVPAPLASYLSLLQLAQTSGSGLRYPGSPWLARQLARSKDRLVLCERQPEIVLALRREMGSAGIAIHCRDGYEARALLPPAEKRGLVLIDPPFERADEFDALGDFLAQATQRFSSGIYAAWYPLKNLRAADRLVRRAARSGEVLDLRIDTGASALPVVLKPRGLAIPMPEATTSTDGNRQAPITKRPMTACGLLVLNPPYRFEHTAQMLLDALLPILARGRAGAIKVQQHAASAA